MGLIDKYHVDSKYIIFEITENTYIHNVEAVNRMIQTFHQRGIRISMDDFDSGYSSLNTLKEIIFDYPKDFVDKDGHVSHHHAHIPQTAEYPYYCDISFISNLIREYIDTPVSDILTRRFENDYWGLTDIFRAADKRIGKRRLEILRDSIKNQAAQIIVELRVNKQQTD